MAEARAHVRRDGCATWAAAARAGFAALVLTMLAACAMQPPPQTVPAPPTGTPVPGTDVPADAETPPATIGCDPAPVQELLGQVATASLQARAKAAAGASTLRVLQAGHAAATDYRAGRLNLRLDDDGRLARAFCG